jgi:hypothetical protein
MQKPTLGVVLLCFNNEKVLEASLRELERLDMSAFGLVELHVFDPGYPLKNYTNWKAVVRKHCGYYYEMTNKGQTKNILATVPFMAKYDYVLAWEPDAKLNNRNYLNICMEHIALDKEVGYVMPMHQEWVYQRQGETRMVTSALEAKEVTFQGGWPQVFYTKAAWAKLFALTQSCKGPYGGTEYDIWKALQPVKGLMLRNVVDTVDQSLYDDSYKAWKAETIGRDDQKFFEEHLKI